MSRPNPPKEHSPAPGSTAGSTPRVPAEPGALLKANTSVREEEPQLHPGCHPGTGTLGRQAAGRGSLKEPQLGAEKPSGSWEDAEAPGTGRAVLSCWWGAVKRGMSSSREHRERGRCLPGRPRRCGRCGCAGRCPGGTGDTSAAARSSPGSSRRGHRAGKSSGAGGETKRGQGECCCP